MTRDNISIAIDSCAYYHLEKPHLAHYRMQNLQEAVQKVCGGIIKNTISNFTFQDLLEKRDDISRDIEEQIEPIVKYWGVIIDKIFLKGNFIQYSRFWHFSRTLKITCFGSSCQKKC